MFILSIFKGYNWISIKVWFFFINEKNIFNVQVLGMAPGLQQLEIIPFRVAAYDTKVNIEPLFTFD